MSDWMIYGATGYTGKLVTAEAVRRGHRPLLAGRSAEKLRALAEPFGLETVAVDLADGDGLRRAISRVRAVYHAAGPFIHTSAPMLRACLDAGVSYLDITGEIPVYQQAFAQDTAARAKGVAILPGVGFDVVPSDCLLKYVADQLPDATHLEVALAAIGGPGGVSAGTMKSMLELMPAIGNAARRGGQLVRLSLRDSGPQTFPFPAGPRSAIPIPWGDLEMGWRSTGIPNITTYMAFDAAMASGFRFGGGLLALALRSAGVRRLMGGLIDRTIHGPSEETRRTGRSTVYVRARNARGDQREGWVETAEAYEFTARAAVLAVERLLGSDLRGALTPSQAFGADFVLAVEGSRRMDSLS